MNFKLGEKYIVDVTENGIIPLMEFDRDRWHDKDSDDLDFLTYEEKKVVVNEMLDEVRAELEAARFVDKNTKLCKNANASGLEVAMQIIDKYKAEREE